MYAILNIYKLVYSNKQSLLLRTVCIQLKKARPSSSWWPRLTFTPLMAYCYVLGRQKSKHRKEKWLSNGVLLFIFFLIKVSLWTVCTWAHFFKINIEHFVPLVITDWSAFWHWDQEWCRSDLHISGGHFVADCMIYYSNTDAVIVILPRLK